MARRNNSGAAVSLGLALSLWTASPGVAQDPAFHEAQLRAGQEALQLARPADAVVHFRIAAFGFLTLPVRLSEALARLALAQQATGEGGAVAATLTRFLEVERRFQSFAGARLEPQARRDFRRLLESAIPRATLAAFPSIAPTPATPSASTAGLPPAGGETVAPTETVSRRPVEAGRPSSAAPPGRAEPPSARPGPASGDTPVDEPPRFRATVRPRYPAQALRNGIGGTVILRVLVSETGEAMEVAVVRQIHPELSAAAVEAVRRWEWQPARRGGRPVTAWTTVPIPFRP